MPSPEDEAPAKLGEEAPAAETWCPIIGIGASAGGLDALKRLLPKVVPDCGMAFIIVQHLAPDYRSILSELLAPSSKLPVTQVEEDMAVEANHVYVIPPNAALTVQDGHLQLERPAHRNPIDELLASLARDQGERAAGVILSGTGSDGTIGLRAIKENGGLTIAQAEAEYDGMMRSALATGLVDYVLRAQDIPAKLVDYFQHITRLGAEKGSRSVASQTADQLTQITGLLRARTGHDFSAYKNGTIIRRVQRRMHVLQLDDVSAFVERLRRDSREVNLLFQDLLIGVTSFFRDRECFDALGREVIPKLFEGKGPDDTLRVWVPGCSTGEEAYSIAILLREHAPKGLRNINIQIFASDIDDDALQTARVGRYPASISKDVSLERLERFFLREDGAGTFRVNADLRQICLFSLHNVLRDAPFSKLDLISCRNLLMYLRTEVQDRVITLFHYALNLKGYLFLGSAENVTRHGRLFGTIDKAHRIFGRRGVQDRRVPEFPLVPTYATGRVLAGQRYRAQVAEPNLKTITERQLLERFTPAYVVVNSDGDLLQSSSRTGKYLELPEGPPQPNVFGMARQGLRMDMRASLHKAVTTNRLVVQPKVRVNVNGGEQEIDLYVQPVRVGAPPETVYMFVFQDLGSAQPIAETEEHFESADVENVRQLETELRLTRERLQTTSEELESSNEELKSSNEELQSMNEELQSTNEELETSKEELQSINEELQTVNAELNARVEELSRANNDMTNLLESTQIATVFLDRTLAVKSFTPAAKDVLPLVESDIGRPIMHVRPNFESDTLQEDAERVLRTLAAIEHPVKSNKDGRRYMMRMLPYRTGDNVINGVVITFTDITRISEAEARIEQLAADLRTRVSELETLLDLVPVGVMVVETDSDAGVLINTHGVHLLGGTEINKGLTPAKIPFRLYSGDAEVPIAEQPLQRAASTGEAIHGWQGRVVDRTGRTVHVMISATPLFSDAGGVRGAIAAIVDVSEHKQAEERQQVLLYELQHRVKNILTTITSLATRMSRRHQTIESFHEAFLSRIAAMGRVHDLLSGGVWTGADMGPLIGAVVQPYVSVGGANVSMAGGELRLRSTAATTLGMVLYELATNAAKYGAWATPGGSVDIAWKRYKPGKVDERVEFTWVEHGDVKPERPHPSGFGTIFITRSVEYELTGKASLDFAPEGLRCTIEFPVAGNLQGFADTRR
jgi:two-component system CheB/CheR fusion protein